MWAAIHDVEFFPSPFVSRNHVVALRKKLGNCNNILVAMLLKVPLSSIRRPSNAIILAAIASAFLVFQLLRIRGPSVIFQAAHITPASRYASLEDINNATLGVSCARRLLTLLLH